MCFLRQIFRGKSEGSYQSMKNKKILFVGAGASADAGYPLTSRLWKTLRDHKGYQTQKESFKKIEGMFNKEKGLLNGIFSSDGLEGVFTFNDLIEKCLVYEKDYKLDQMIEEHSRGRFDTNKYRTNVLCAREKFHEDFVKIKKGIEKYFLKLLNETKNPDPDDYIHRMLDDKSTVITTNWDALVEFYLWNKKKWHPSGGYGFDIEIDDADCFESTVKVLKLHGGIGWRKTKLPGEDESKSKSDNKITVCKEFLNWLCERNSGSIESLLFGMKDKNSSKQDGFDEPFMQFPTYAKEIEQEQLVQIWSLASQALEECSEISFVGYSLPSSDTHVRALLLPLRNRVKSNKVKVKIITGKEYKETIERWKKFFGETNSVEYIQEYANIYFKTAT